MSAPLVEQLAQAEQAFRSGNSARAEPLLREVLRADTHNARAAELLAYIAANRGDLEHALELLKVATASPAASGEAHYYLGKLYLERAQFAPAADAFRRAVRHIGDFFEGLHDLGVALSGNGEAQAALDAYDRAQRLNPNAAPLYYNQGVALDALKRFDDAIRAYDRAIALEANFAEAWDNRGASLNDICRYDEALTSHDQALGLNPNNARAWSNRGATLAALKRFDEALESHKKALTLQPDFAEAWGRAGAALSEMNRRDEACDHFERAYALRPDIPYLQGDRLHAKMLLCRWGDAASGDTITRESAAALAGIDAGVPVMTPFVALSLPATRAQQLRCAELYTRGRYFTPANPFAGGTGHTRGKIRLGYFSPDFRTHAVSFLTAGLFEQHDRARFEVHAFALKTAADDAMAARLKVAFDHFHDVGHLADAQLVDYARSRGIDIAVDLAGHTDGARTGIFARRVAPVQVNYLGFPGGMGASFVDYLIADDKVVPAAHRADYAEKIVVMPHCFQVNDDKRDIAATPSRAQHGLKEEAFVLCCFNTTYKINPQMFDLWLDVLRQIDHAVLWLVGDGEEPQRRLRQWAQARGVAAERLVFAQRLPYAEHLARYRLADLVLDTLPFNGGTTTSDALWGGAPVLTCSGDTFAGRMASSLLHAIGLPELVTATLSEYRDQALQLARNPQRIAHLKATLATNRNTHPLFDTRLFTRHIEQAYESMWQRYVNGLPPDHLTIAPLGNPP